MVGQSLVPCLQPLRKSNKYSFCYAVTVRKDSMAVDKLQDFIFKKKGKFNDPFAHQVSHPIN
jgi:hypothetical protein